MSKIKVQHEVLKKGGLVRFRKFSAKGYEHFKIRLSIQGTLSDIEYVEYELHPTFSDNVRISKDRDGGFPIEFWTWGEFEILVTVHYVNGEDKVLTYNLEYSTELPSEDSAYNDETPKSIMGQNG